MGSYKVTKPCFLNGKRCKVGDVVGFDGKAPSYLAAIEQPEKAIEQPEKAKKTKKP